MSTDPKYQAALALHRFGLGPRPAPMAGSIEAVASDPRGALLAELEKPGAGLVVDASLMTAAKSSMAAFNFREARQAAEIAQKMANPDAMANAAAAKPAEPPKPAEQNKPAEQAKPAQQANAAPPAKPGNPPQPPEPTVPQKIIRGEARARFGAAHAAEVGFVERLVWFWSNHFCVSSFVVAVMAGGYEREAIRPHVLGRFADMLVASAR